MTPATENSRSGKRTGRIDALVELAMAVGMLPTEPEPEYQILFVGPDDRNKKSPW